MRKFLFISIIALMSIPTFANEKFKDASNEYETSNSTVTNSSDDDEATVSLYFHIPMLILSTADDMPTIFMLTLENELTPGMTFVSQPYFGTGKVKFKNYRFKNWTIFGGTGGLRKYFRSESTGWYVQADVGYQSQSFDVEADLAYSLQDVNGDTTDVELATGSADRVTIMLRLGRADRLSDGISWFWDIGYGLRKGEMNVESNIQDSNIPELANYAFDINLGMGFSF